MGICLQYVSNLPLHCSFFYDKLLFHVVSVKWASKFENNSYATCTCTPYWPPCTTRLHAQPRTFQNPPILGAKMYTNELTLVKWWKQQTQILRRCISCLLYMSIQSFTPITLWYELCPNNNNLLASSLAIISTEPAKLLNFVVWFLRPGCCRSRDSSCDGNWDAANIKNTINMPQRWL